MVEVLSSSRRNKRPIVASKLIPCSSRYYPHSNGLIENLAWPDSCLTVKMVNYYLRLKPQECYLPLISSLYIILALIYLIWVFQLLLVGIRSHGTYL